MPALLVVGLGDAPGKTALCAGLGKHFLGRGERVGFFKPRPSGEGLPAQDPDASFLAALFQLNERAEALAPMVEVSARTGEPGLASPQELRGLSDAIAQDRHILLVEGWGSLEQDSARGFLQGVAEALDARVILLLRYAKGSTPQSVRPLLGELGQRLVGVVINALPETKVPWIQPAALRAAWQEANMPVLAVLPEDRTLLGFSVGELAEHMEAEFLVGRHLGGQLVENLMVGANTAEAALHYFQRKANKAVITRADRPDIIMVALDTSTRCLLLTGPNPPLPHILHLAEDRQVPVLRVSSATVPTVLRLQEIYHKVRFHQLAKVSRLEQLLEERVAFAALEGALASGESQSAAALDSTSTASSREVAQ